MDFTRQVLIHAAWMLIYCYAVVGQSDNNNNTLNFMPGSSPATPNRALRTCQSQARPRPYNVTYQGVFAQHIYSWCSTYDDVLPCLNRTLPPSNDVTDWFLKLILDQSRATRMSRSMCTRFPFLTNLTCADEGMERARTCMEWSTKSAIDQFYSQFKPGQPLTEEKRRLASIYACITTVATAGCLHKKLTLCSAPKRKLIYDYYIMFSGQCQEIAGLQDPTVTSTTLSPSRPLVPNVTETIQMEDTKLNTALEAELDNKPNADAQSKNAQNVTEPTPTARNKFVRSKQSSDNNSGYMLQGCFTWCVTMVSWSILMTLL